MEKLGFAVLVAGILGAGLYFGGYIGGDVDVNLTEKGKQTVTDSLESTRQGINDGLKKMQEGVNEGLESMKVEQAPQIKKRSPEAK